MLSFQQNIFSSQTISNVTELELGEGDCTTTPLAWTSAYLPGVNVSSINNGDVFYTDSSLTTPFDGNDMTHRARIPSMGLSPVFDIEFDVSDVGVVSNVTSCSGGGGGGIFLDGAEQNTSCYSAQCFVVTLGSAASKTVTIIKTGLALYGSIDSCPTTVGQIVTSDFTETITANKTYKLSIDSDSGTGTGVTTISINAVGGGDNDTLVLTRNHSDIPQQC